MSKVPTIKKTIGFLGAVLLGLLLLNNPSITEAQSVDQLRSQINEQQKKIEELDREIELQKQKIANTSQQANSLENTINQLEATKRKLEADIGETEAQIIKSELTIEKLDFEISDKETQIDVTSIALAESLRQLNNLDQVTLVEQFLAYNNFSDFWNNFKSLQQFQDRVIDTVLALRELNNELKEKQGETIEEKEFLEKFKVELAGEEVAIEYTQKEKSTLLNQTRSEEYQYQQILDQKQAEREKFRQELFDFESQLKSLVDPNSIPDGVRGLFGWPVDNVYITQLFGETAFARTTNLYSRPFHNGVDFGTPIGTKVRSVLPGTIVGFDNTDLYPGCNSWGAWVLVEHDNGLSTLYAHNSSILVSKGQRVEKGEVIALSGTTGVSTGPHLHLTVYASQGVKVRAYRDIAPSSYGCGATAASIPTASLDAYLDPMKYLP
jgi:murein DD-endopeptidase MepM/ murein hydrolase activator NlpD